jgi:predicted MFS family arabinose efflux permease
LGRRARVLIDLAPLRRSRDLRLLVFGEQVSVLGTQLTTVAVPYQVYRLTHSSLDVGLVSLAQLLPLIGGALLGGSVVDAMDRRRMLMLAQVLMAGCSAGLAVNADLGTSLWPLFVLPALAAGFGGLDDAGRSAIIPNLVERSEIPNANAIFQSLFQFGVVVGPAVAGLLLAGAGVRFVYWLDVASFAAALLAAFLLSPQPPVLGAAGHRPGLRSIVEGLGFVRGRQSIQGAYLIDINAMVFGMPRALFPALATTLFGGGASTLGFLYAAPGAGALIGALTTGWVSQIRRQGLAVIVAVLTWGVAITCFGLVSWLPGALALLAVAGWADVISAVFRNTIIQVAVPDALRGRLSGLQIAVVAGGPRIGDVESGAVAAAFGDTVSVVSGGLACIAGALVLARLLPGFRQQRTPEPSGVSGVSGAPARIDGGGEPAVGSSAGEGTDNGLAGAAGGSVLIRRALSPVGVGLKRLVSGARLAGVPGRLESAARTRRRSERRHRVGARNTCSVYGGFGHLQQCSRLSLSTLGGGGNRTRVLQCITRASPCAACCAFLSPGDHASKSPTGSAAV